MDKPEILNILGDWNFWRTEPTCGIPRDRYLARLRNLLASRQVVVITGPRRAGKSFLMRQLARSMIRDGLDSRQTLFVNFEDPRWPQLDTSLLERIFDCYLESIHREGKPLLLLDEIQEVKDWEKWVRMVHELDRATVVIAGSNAKLLSQELSTLLTGRHVDQLVLPLSFRERLRFADLDTSDPTTLQLHVPTVKKVFTRALEAGSFPAVVSVDRPEEILLSYYDDIVQRDVIRRHRVRKREELKRLARFYASNISCPVTFNSIARFLEMTPESADSFSAHLQTAFLFFFVKRFSPRVKEQERSPRKVYAVDTGLANVVGSRISKSEGSTLENFVFLELLSQSAFDPDLRIHYWKDARHKEVDFLLMRGHSAIELIQVCWTGRSPLTRNREVRSLLSAMEELGVTSALVITAEEEAVEHHGKSTLRFVPAWKWASGMAT